VSGLPTEQELIAAHCWEESDRVPGRPAMTDFRRRLRYHQAKWRGANGHPIGTQPIMPKPGDKARLVGSRLPLDYARESGANFVSTAALEAARDRTSFTERHQSFDHQRLWADLLWSPSFSFNLFGDLATDMRLADRAVHTLWPDTPGKVSEVRFAHSPGRLDWAFIGSLVDFDVVFVLELGAGARGIIAMDVKYHDQIQRHVPKPERLPRYLEVTERSGVFRAGAVQAVNGTKLLVMWLEHILVLSMLQQASGEWGWGRYVTVYPAGNSDYAAASIEYRELLVGGSTYTSTTVEELLASGALPRATTTALRRRYLPD
jgi:hypothetical protein